MVKTKSQYRCSCGRVEPKWLGLCPHCGRWNSFEEVGPTEQVAPNRIRVSTVAPVPAVQVGDNQPSKMKTSLPEIDRVLGGGVVQGCSVLLGGEPGIGKSTLLLQICTRLASLDAPALVVSGEESPQQVRARAQRLALDLDKLHLLSSTDCQVAQEVLLQERYSLVVVDSIQTMRCPDLNSAAGSVSQVRECAMRLAEVAKQRGLPVFFIGHVTKEGTLAGPRTLEHLVDTVLYFEADPSRTLRIVRAHKNRHGPMSEIAVLEMTAQGLIEVGNPSAAFLADRPQAASGSVVFSMMRGSRPILVEVQALVAPNGGGQPRRTAWGCDPSRVALLAAVLERRASIQLSGCDLFLNVVGGLTLDEPASDLAMCVAMLSSITDKPTPSRLVVFGEVGLAGEIRSVSHAQTRISEALRLGYDSIVLPAGCVDLTASEPNMRLLPAANVGDLQEIALT